MMTARLILKLALITLGNDLFAQRVDFSDKLHCRAFLDSIGIEISGLTLISGTQSTELKRLEKQLFAPPTGMDSLVFDSIQLTLNEQNIYVPMRNIHPENMAGRMIDFHFHGTLDYDCYQVENRLGDLTQIFKPDTMCPHSLVVITDDNDCLVKFKGNIVRDCKWQNQLNGEIRVGKPARYE